MADINLYITDFNNYAAIDLAKSRSESNAMFKNMRPRIEEIASSFNDLGSKELVDLKDEAMHFLKQNKFYSDIYYFNSDGSEFAEKRKAVYNSTRFYACLLFEIKSANRSLQEPLLNFDQQVFLN